MSENIPVYDEDDVYSVIAYSRERDYAYLTAIIEYIEEETSERLSALSKAAEDCAYDDMRDICATLRKVKANQLMKEVLVEKKLSTWQRIEHMCIIFNKPDLRERLLLAAQKRGVGKQGGWVLSD